MPSCSAKVDSGVPVEARGRCYQSEPENAPAGIVIMASRNKSRPRVRDTLGKPGNPTFFSSSFSLELPSVCAKVFKSTLLDRYKPCFVPSLMKPVSKKFEEITLSRAGVKLRDTPNAGGASVRSEVMSIEVLQRAFSASLKASEMEVNYYPPNGPITDFVCEINGENLGVSVTRAFHFRGQEHFCPEDARRLLRKKLEGVVKSTKTVLFPEFRRQILHVWCKSKRIAELLEKEYYRLRSAVRSNTVLFVTVCETEWLYDERCTRPVKVKKKVADNKGPAYTPVSANGRKARRARQRHLRTIRRKAETALMFKYMKFYLTVATTFCVFLMVSMGSYLASRTPSVRILVETYNETQPKYFIQRCFCTT
eukprot:TRINITY_DN78_c2_g6_i1.p1 TRINITY_DN78_c2_g6~~TRINITY_DN78_c2_g6_i1.p1  ORF type:complete len:366 (+),score=32.83 TRINITY_DN78_c2_g6_i1:279-1376(+)